MTATLLTTTDAIAQLVDSLGMRGDITLPSAVRSICELTGQPHHGDYTVELADNLVVLIGVSKQAAAVLGELLGSGRVEMKPTSLFVYMMDGDPIPLDMPEARRIPANGYRQPHWLPVLLVATPAAQAR